MKIIKNRKHNVNADRATRARQFGIKAARIGKTKQVSVLQGNYGYGWDDLCEYDGTSNRECREDLKLYRENEPGVPFRVIYRRVPNPDYVETPVEQSTSTKRKYTIEASKSAKRKKHVMASDEDGYFNENNTRFEREQFAESIVHEIEDEYSIKVSDGAWGKIYDLAYDLSLGADAHKHGSDPMCVLEDYIYEIIEEDAGIVIGSTSISAAQADTTVSQEDVDELVLYITNDGNSRVCHLKREKRGHKASKNGEKTSKATQNRRIQILMK